MLLPAARDVNVLTNSLWVLYNKKRMYKGKTPLEA